MANAFGQFLRPSQEQQIADSYIQEIGRGDRTAGDRFGQYLGSQEAAQASDPFAQRYEDIGESQTEGLIFDQPEQEMMREDALMRTLAPIQERAKFEQQANEITANTAERQFQQRDATQRRGQDLGVQKTGRTQEGQNQRTQNAMLEAQAKKAQETGEGTYNPLRWMMGRPTGEEQAATLRGQQQFDQQAVPSVAGGEDIRSEVATRLQSVGINPQFVDEVMADPAAMAELGF